MLFNSTKYPFFFWLFAVPFLVHCSQPTSTNNNSEGDSTSQDSIISAENVEHPATETLPKWPLKPKSIEGKRFPFDEGPKDQSFASFREKLFQAVLQKDLNFLNSIIHKDIKFSFGAENGKEDFLKTWQLDSNPKNSTFWEELKTVLSLGGAFLDEAENNFYAPYIFILEDIEDPYTQAIIIGEKVRLRDQASSQSKIINSLNWDLVEIVNQDEYIEETINGETHFWQKVKTAKRETGFVYGKYVRSPIDFRVGFAKDEGEWSMDLFIAGD